jgi:hypothetical protein
MCDFTPLACIRLWNASFALNAAAIVPCVLTTVPILSPGISSLVSTNAMVLIINLVRSPEASSSFTYLALLCRADPFITGRLSRSTVCIFYIDCRHALNTEFGQSLIDILNRERPDDRFDFLHIG